MKQVTTIKLKIRKIVNIYQQNKYYIWRKNSNDTF